MAGTYALQRACECICALTAWLEQHVSRPGWLPLLRPACCSADIPLAGASLTGLCKVLWLNLND